MDQPALFPDLLPTLPGKVAGIVAHYPGAGRNGRDLYDIQCQRCGAIETPDPLVLMKFIFPKCQRLQGEGRRLCPDCHDEMHDPAVRDCD